MGGKNYSVKWGGHGALAKESDWSLTSGKLGEVQPRKKD